jgi:hypothetical protein
VRRSRRQLNVGPDGTAEVVLLTNPIPRHLSIVDWGANDRPASSWKSASPPGDVLRDPPGPQAIQRAGASADELVGFIDETLDAWETVLIDVLDRPIAASDRAARVIACTNQAAARVAALAVAVGHAKMAEVASQRRVDLQPHMRLEANTETQIDRNAFVRSLGQAKVHLRDSVVSVLAAGGEGSSTETILGIFSEVGCLFAQWASEIRDGVVGVAAKSSSTPQEAPVLTIVMLAALAKEDPVGFLEVVDQARKDAAAKFPEAAKKFAWGDTGVEQFDPQEFIRQLRDFQGGEAILGMIASAVSSVDVDAAASISGTPKVNSAMKSAARAAFAKTIAAEIKANPSGDLANAIKEMVAPSVAEAMVQTMKAFYSSPTPQGDPAGAFGFAPEEDDGDPLEVEMPALNRMVGARG